MSLKVSVIVPSYNRAHFLPTTLESILAQTLAPVEVIVVDDGSKDNTGEVVAAFAPRGVRYLRIENSGVCRARNAGIRASSGEWIAFCDSDDLWTPDRLAIQADIVAKRPAVGFVFSTFAYVVGDRWETRDKLSEFGDYFRDLPVERLGEWQLVVTEPMYAKQIREFAIVPSTMLMSREFLDRIGGIDESFTRVSVEDIEFVLRIVQEAPIGVVTKPIVGMRRHGANAAGNQFKDITGTALIYEFALAHHRMARQHEALLRERLRRIQLESVDLAFAAREYRVAREFAGKLRGAPWKTRLKAAISAMPEPVRGWLAATTLRGRR